MNPSTKAVFLSYAREDTDAARRIAEALRSQGIEVWFDQAELRGGDAWDAKIKSHIRECALFLPVVSAQTQERPEGYFRREWKLAVERTQNMAAGVAFIAPVVVDETSESVAAVPEEFMRVQWMRLPGALPSLPFAEQVKHLLEAPRKAAPVGRAGVSAPIPAGTMDQKRSVGRSLVLVNVLVLIGVVGYFALRPSENTATALIAEPKTQSSESPVLAFAKSIAVLPFENLSDDKDASSFFADGMHEDVLTNLASIRELRVTSRTSVMEYRGTRKKIPDIAKELGVAWILEGSVRRVGTKVRITGQLINARTDEHVWAKSFDRDLTDIFAVQAALATEIAGALRAVLSPEEQKLIARRPTENLEAYDLFLKARTANSLLTAGALRAQRYAATLERVLQLDPNFAPAWIELSRAYSEMYFFGVDHTEARVAKARRALETAERLDPDLPELLRARATYYFRCYYDYARATAALETLLAMQPSNQFAWTLLGVLQRRQGKWTEAVKSMRTSLALDPRSLPSWVNLYTTLDAGRRYPEAQAALVEFAGLDPAHFDRTFTLHYESFRAHGSTREVDQWLAELKPEQFNSSEGLTVRKKWALARGKFDEAVRLGRMQNAPANSGIVVRARHGLEEAVALAAQGNLAEARMGLEPLRAALRTEIGTDRTSPILHALIGQVEAVLGHQAEALNAANEACRLLPESVDALDGSGLSSMRAFVHAWTGDKERAIAEYARLMRIPRAYNVGGPQVPTSVHEMKTHPDFFPLRGDPRFEELLSDPKNNAPLF